MEKCGISAVILLKSGRESIGKCIASLYFCGEIVIVDDNSDAETLIQARIAVKNNRHKLKIYKRELNGDFSASRNFGLGKCNNNWVLFVDADEYVSDSLAKEIVSKYGQSDTCAYFLRRKDVFLGKKLNFGETGKMYLARLGRKNKVQWEGTVHETMQYKGKACRLKEILWHERKMDLAGFLDRLNFYSTLRAEKNIADSKKFSLWEFFFYPTGKFILNYFIKFGFLDGIEGFVMAYMMSFHSMLVRIKMYEKLKR